MMPAPPATVDIGPHTYRIVVDGDNIMGEKVGQCDSVRLTIALDGDQEFTQLADTLLHEITHAILATAGLEDEIEERVCLAMGPGLLALMRENPDLVRWVGR